jgi:DNA-binding beta-propeller fold protein YncE
MRPLLALCGIGISAFWIHFNAPYLAGAAFGGTVTKSVLLVVNQGDKNLSVVDPATERQIAMISQELTTVHGHEVAASPDGRFAYVPVYGSGVVGGPGIDGREMLVIDIRSRKISGKVDFGNGVRPHCVVYDPVSGLLYVTTELANSVTIVDPKSLKVVGTIPTTQPQSHMLAISHDGRRGYTANVKPGSVSVLDIAARKTTTVIPISPVTQRISISNDDSMVFTADQSKPQLAVIDTSTNTIKNWVPLPASGYGTASTRDGRWLLVAIGGFAMTPSKMAIPPPQGGVAVVDLRTLQVTRTIPVPGAAQEVLMSPDGKVAYVSCMVHTTDGASGKQIGQVAVIELSEWKVQSLIDVGVGADGLAWANGS